MKTRGALLTKKYSDSDFDESDLEYSSPKEKKFFCAICGLSYKSSSTLAMHMSCHKGEETYKCQKSGCNAKFKSKAQLAAHQRNHLALASLFSPNHIEIFKVINKSAYRYDKYASIFFRKQSRCNYSSSLKPSPNFLASSY